MTKPSIREVQVAIVGRIIDPAVDQETADVLADALSKLYELEGACNKLNEVLRRYRNQKLHQRQRAAKWKRRADALGFFRLDKETARRISGWK